MNKTELLIDTLKNSPNGITINDAYKIFKNKDDFYSTKSIINSNRIKYKDIQIIRTGKNGRSIWKFAQDNPKQTIGHCKGRHQKAIKNLWSAAIEKNIAIGSENNNQIRMQLVAEANKESIRISQIINNLI